MRDAVTGVGERRRRGLEGEERAAAWLAARGWRIRERNFRSRHGEIDIIAQKGSQIAFVEVKSWASLPASELEYSVSARKQRRITQTAKLYLARNPAGEASRLRFDVIFLGREPDEVRHIEGAFDGGDG